jgi:hypothetical protein
VHQALESASSNVLSTFFNPKKKRFGSQASQRFGVHGLEVAMFESFEIF